MSVFGGVLRTYIPTHTHTHDTHTGYFDPDYDVLLEEYATYTPTHIHTHSHTHTHTHRGILTLTTTRC